MKDGIILVNMVCGGLIDELVLIVVLVLGKLCVVGLDSFEKEFFIVLYLLQDVSNVILSLYIGGVMVDVYIVMGIGVVSNVLVVLNEQIVIG